MIMLHAGARRILLPYHSAALLLTVMLIAFPILSPKLARAQEMFQAFHTHKGYSGKLEAPSGLNVVSYQTPSGKIVVCLPSNMRESESVVGTMRLQPKGKDDNERAASRASLASYHIAWGAQSQAVQETPVTWTPPVGQAGPGKLTLADAQDRPVAQIDLAAAAAEPQSGKSPGSSTNLPRRGIVLHPVVLPMAVGSEARAYTVLVGGKPARLLAASPRSLIVESPDVPGKTTLQVKKGDLVVAEAPFRNDRAIRSTNPWPYIIIGVAAIGIVGAIEINKTVHDIGNGLGSGFGNLSR